MHWVDRYIVIALLIAGFSSIDSGYFIVILLRLILDTC